MHGAVDQIAEIRNRPMADIGVISPSAAAGSITGSSMMTTEIFGLALSACIFCRLVSELVPS